MKILLTGSSGFIGTHIKKRIETIGTVYDLKSDLTSYSDVENEIYFFKPDLVVHLAARTEVQYSFYEQVSFSETNYVGTVNLIESCRKLKKSPFFLFASTMEVYGWQPISDEVKMFGIPKNFIAFDEYTNPNPNAPYAVAKYAGEKYLQYAKRSYGFNFSVIRQTNAYGRNDNDFFITEHIIKQMLLKNEIMLGYAEPYRNFIFIDDLLDVWMSVIENKERCDGEIFTIGPNDPRKIKDCVEFIAKKLDWNGNVLWDTKPIRPGEIYWLNSDQKKIKSFTGWSSKVSYEEGIEKTINIWKENIHKSKK